MRKVNNVDLAGLNDFFDTAQINMKNTTADAATLIAIAVAAEREACAQLVDDLVAERVPASTYSHAIRARGGE